MDAKEAIGTAKSLIRDLYADEAISQVRLEEIEFDDSANAWLVTLGLLHEQMAEASSFAEALGTHRFTRAYKIVKIPNDGRGKPSMRIRELSVDG